MATATWQDVQTALGRPLSQNEQERAEWWLNGAEVQIRARLGDVDLLDRETVTYVEAEAVAARMMNPDNYTSESIDDYTYRYGSETRQVVIRDDWWALLAPARGSFFTIPVSSPLDIP